MRIFDIDVSGEDLLKKDYTICIADKNSFIQGFKFSEELISILSSKYGQNIYRYSKSKKGKSDLKVRIYCVIIYNILKSMNISEEISLNICRDFNRREEDIKINLKFFLENKVKLKIEDRFYFQKLDKNSNAHKYSYLMRFDTKNQMKNYVKINLEDIEKWLKK